MFTVNIETHNIKLSVPKDTLLMNILTEAGLMKPDYPCGGFGMCGKCKVKIRTNTGRKDVLACQTKISSDLEVQLDKPNEFEIHSVPCVNTTIDTQLILDPAVKKIFIPFSSGSSLCWEDLCAHLSLSCRTPVTNIGIVHDLSYYVYLNEGFTVVLYNRDIIKLEPGNTSQNLYGMAFDIGTTNIVGYLFNLTDGKLLATVSGLNPQVKYGADVIARITFAGQAENALTTLKNSVIAFVDELIGKAAELAFINRRDIYDFVFVGNPCMQHLFLGINPQSLGLPPYQPVFRQPTTINADSIGLDANEAAKTHWLPGAAGFVGADTVGMLLSSQIDCNNKIVLAVDIGTNGEMALWDGNNIWACSAAAGPAFEGMSMSCGMRAQAGAIDKVDLSGNEVVYSVIGGDLPSGICGSGFFSAISAMINSGLIDDSGRLVVPEDGVTWSQCFRKNDAGLAFVLVSASKTRNGHDIVISQRDIRQMQLAKGAIAAGIRILVKEAGISEKDIQEIIVSGAFGLFLNPRDIMTVGLLSEIPCSKIISVGNAAGLGAQKALLSKKTREIAWEKAAKINNIDLAKHPDFTETFINSINYSQQT